MTMLTKIISLIIDFSCAKIYSMRVKITSTKKIGFLLQRTLFLLSSFFIFSTMSLYAQNGIPIDVLQNDPYFRSGSTDKSLEDTEEQSTKDSTEEETKTESEETPTESTEQNSTIEEESETTNIPISEETKDSLQDKNKTEVKIPQPVEIIEDVVDAKID